MRWTGMVCDLINENSIVTYHAILVMNMYIQSHTLTHKQHRTLRKKLMWYRQMKLSLPFRSKYEIFTIYFCVHDSTFIFQMLSICLQNISVSFQFFIIDIESYEKHTNGMDILVISKEQSIRATGKEQKARNRLP